MSTFQVNAMTRAYGMYAKSLEAYADAQKTDSKDEGFMQKLAKKTQGVTITEETAKLAASGGVSTADMSMEEYKSYIYDEISRIKQHPSQWQDSIAINISEAGFEAMKNDPEYEAWVLDYLRRDFACRDPWSGICGGKYVVHYFGASKEEYHGHSWYPEYAGGSGKSMFDARSKDSFWKRRMDKQKANEDYVKKLQERRRLQEKRLQQLAKRRAWSSDLTAAGAAYEMNFLVMDESAGAGFST